MLKRAANYSRTLEVQRNKCYKKNLDLIPMELQGSYDRKLLFMNLFKHTTLFQYSSISAHEIKLGKERLFFV